MFKVKGCVWFPIIESNINSKKTILNQYLDYVEEKLHEGHDLSKMMRHLFGLSRGDKFA